MQKRKGAVIRKYQGNRNDRVRTEPNRRDRIRTGKQQRRKEIGVDKELDNCCLTTPALLSQTKKTTNAPIH